MAVEELIQKLPKAWAHYLASVSPYVALVGDSRMKWGIAKRAPDFIHGQSPWSDPLYAAYLTPGLFRAMGQTYDRAWQRVLFDRGTKLSLGDARPFTLESLIYHARQILRDRPSSLAHIRAIVSQDIVDDQAVSDCPQCTSYYPPPKIERVNGEILTLRAVDSGFLYRSIGGMFDNRPLRVKLDGTLIEQTILDNGFQLPNPEWLEAPIEYVIMAADGAVEFFSPLGTRFGAKFKWALGDHLPVQNVGAITVRIPGMPIVLDPKQVLAIPFLRHDRNRS